MKNTDIRQLTCLEIFVTERERERERTFYWIHMISPRRDLIIEEFYVDIYVSHAQDIVGCIASVN